MAMARKLGNLIFDEVSLVDRPANQHGVVVFAKRDTRESGPMGFYTADGQPIAEPDVQMGQKVYNEAGEEFELGMVDLNDPDLVFVDDEGNEIERESEHEDEGQLVGVGKRETPLSQVFLDELSKAMTQDGRDEVVAKALGRMEEIEKRNNDLTRVVSELVDANARRDFTEIAKGYEMPFEADDLGGLLQRLSKSLSPQDMAAVDQILTAGSEFAKQAALLEIGYAGGQPSTVYDEVAGAAADVVAKSGGGLSFDQAAVAFFDANPDAYDQYESEQRDYR